MAKLIVYWAVEQHGEDVSFVHGGFGWCEWLQVTLAVLMMAVIVDLLFDIKDKPDL